MSSSSEFRVVSERAFLTLVAEIREEAVLAERKACLEIVANHAAAYNEPVWAISIMSDIQARGNNK